MRGLAAESGGRARRRFATGESFAACRRRIGAALVLACLALILAIAPVAAQVVPDGSGQAPAQTSPEGEPAADDRALEDAPIIVSLGGRIALITQEIAELAADAVQDLWRTILRIPRTFDILTDADYSRLSDKLLDLVVLVVFTYSAFFIVRRIVENLRRFLMVAKAGSSLLVFVAAVLMLLVTNLFIVFAAWVVGYAVSLSVFGVAGEMAFHHSLYLNAFLVMESVHACIRAVLAPRRPDLRMIPMSDAESRALTRRSRLTLSTLVYGQMLLVPIVNQNVSFTAGRVFSTAVYLLVLAMLVNVVLRKREAITGWLDRQTSDIPGTLIHFLARFWHVPVLIYLIALFAVVLIRPEHVLIGMLGATGKIIAAFVAGIAVAGLLSRVMMQGVRLPPTISTHVPMLEQRLNSFVPRALVVLKLLVFGAVTVFTIDSLGLFNLTEWLESSIGVRVTAGLASVLFIVFFSFVAWLTVVSWIDYRLHPRAGRVVKSREKTLLHLVRNAITVSIFVLATMFTLSEIGINIAPLIASAGVIGLAVGFGAQKLVQDIITGLFIQFEGAIDVGDVVSVGGISGTVERLTIRSAGLRDMYGVYHIVPFSSVDTVSNFMRGFAYTVCDIGVAYREDIEEVKTAMLEAFDILKQDRNAARDVVGEMEWLGLDRFDNSAMIVRVRIKTLPGRQWGVARIYNAIVKRVFDDYGIDIPFPHQTLYFGEDKTGRAPALRVIAGKTADRGGSRTTRPSPKRQRKRPETGQKAKPAARQRKGKREAPIPPDSDDAPGAPE